MYVIESILGKDVIVVCLRERERYCVNWIYIDEFCCLNWFLYYIFIGFLNENFNEFGRCLN